MSSKGIYTSEVNQKSLESRLATSLAVYIPKFDGPPHLDELLIKRLVGYLFYQSSPITIHNYPTKRGQGYC